MLGQSHTTSSPIGVFDSGYGGLTILKSIIKQLPQYDYIYLGDNARAPYGTHSFELVYQYTLQAVNYLFNQGCQLVILACNTASAKALRTIQQQDLPKIAPNRRVLGVIRPSIEAIAQSTANNHIGLMATRGTVLSDSYRLELDKLYGEAQMHLSQLPCPMLVPIVENNEIHSEGAAFFVKQYVDQLMAMDKEIDTVILGCTHYPLLSRIIGKYLPPHVNLIQQGDIVANSLTDYLSRHQEIETLLSQNGHIHYLTTENATYFDTMASIFMDENVHSSHVRLS